MNYAQEFQTAAISLFPEIVSSGQITSNQINKTLQSNVELKYPNWINNAKNRISRGVFKFEIDLNTDSVQTAIPIKSAEEIELEIMDRYQSMEMLIEAVANNVVNSLVISGGAGLGKSHTTNKVLNRINNSYIFHKGYLRATGLFRLLWENRNQNQTIVIDDCDSIFNDEVALNILKAALELKQTRTIGWGSEKEFVDDSGEVIPRYFEYSGSVIFLTNLPFSELSQNNSKYSVHLSALESRSLVIDLKIKTKQEYMIKIKQTVRSGMLRDKGIDLIGEYAILEFMDNNIDNLKELSLRMCEKIASLYLLNPVEWHKLAKTVCCK